MQEISSLKSKPSLRSRQGKFDFRPLIAFAATLVFYLMLAVICQKYPFGAYSTSISDLDAQYAPFLALFRNRLGADGSLMYSFDEGLGGNYMATFGYYLASPFNLLFGLFDTSFISGFVLLVLVLKMCFASAFMCKFISVRVEDQKCLWPVIWGIMYAFTAYVTGFLFQIMWMDGYMILPLILYFIERFIKDNKKVGLILSLLYLFFSNFYIAYMAGIFSFLYIVFRMWYLGEFSNMKKALAKIGKFILIAVLDAMILCAYLVPVGLATIGNSDPTSSKNSSHLILYDLSDILDHLFVGLSGDFGDVMPSNLPFFASSSLVLALIVLFFVSKAISNRDKMFYGICLAGVYLSTAVYWFDVAWQVFDEPNWFWHRHAFVFIPLFFVISAKMFENISEARRKEIFISCAVVVSLLFLAQGIGNMEDGKTFLFNLAFIITSFVILFYINKKDWTPSFADMPKIMPLIMAVIVCFEVVYVQPLLSTDMSVMTLYQGNAEQYSQSITAMKDLAESQIILSDKNGSFRAENEAISDYGTTNYVLEHSNMYGNFHGMTFFNSSSNKSLHRFIKQLGFTTNYNYFSVAYSYCAPDSDAFMSIGAMTTMRDYSGAQYVINDPNDIGYQYYANTNVLPLAFAADQKARDFDFYKLEKMGSDKDYFAFRNLWYRSLFPDQFTEDYFLTVSDELVTSEVINGMSVEQDLTTMANIKAEEMRNSGIAPEDEEKDFDRDGLGLEDLCSEEAKENITQYYRINKKIPIYIEFKTVAPNDGEYYFDMSFPTTSGTHDVYVNNILISHASAGTYFSQVHRLGTFSAGDEIKVTISSDEDSFSYLSAYFGYLDYEAFDSQFDQIDKDKVMVNDAIDGYVYLTTDLAQGEMVLTTIPYEDGWTLYIDGQEAEIKPYQQAFISFDVPEGVHACELRFVAPGFKTGLIGSAAGILGMVIFLVADSLTQKKKESGEG